MAADVRLERLELEQLERLRRPAVQKNVFWFQERFLVFKTFLVSKTVCS